MKNTTLGLQLAVIVTLTFAVSLPAVSLAQSGTVGTTGQQEVTRAAAYFFTRNLSVGSTGQEVTDLQQFLTDSKFYTGPITGYFGALTKAGVISFQKTRGILQTGTVGPQTRAELNRGSFGVTASVSGTPGSGLTIAQIDSVIALLQSFGIAQATIDQVRSELNK